MKEKLKVLVYGDEAIDLHLLVDHVASEAVLNDKLNGQSVRMIKDRTGHKLVCDLITEVYKGLFGSEHETDLDRVYQMCSCPEKANYAYYIWKEKPKNSKKRGDKSRKVYYKDLFLGAKFDWINSVDREWVTRENTRRDNLFHESDEEKVDILIFYDRHYNTEGEGCESCGPSARKCDENYGIIKNLLERQKENPPLIFIRTAHETVRGGESSGVETDELRIPKEIIGFINQHEKLRKNTIVLLKLNDLKELGAELPVKYSWEELVKSTYTELQRIRSDPKRSKYIVKSPLIIVDFDYDGYAVFNFTDTFKYSDMSDSCQIVYNKSNINGTGFKELSKTGSIPSSTSILQSIVVSFMIHCYLSQKNVKEREGKSLNEAILDQFCQNLELILKVCYLSIYHYCSTERELKGMSTDDGPEDRCDRGDTFSVDMEKLASFIKDTYAFCQFEMSGNWPQRPGGEVICCADKQNETFIREQMPGFVEIDDLEQNAPLDFSAIIMKKENYDNYKLCKKIVEEGLNVTEIPYICFGGLRSIDRKEIEGYRHIYNLMRHKLEEPGQDHKPLSFCVFGKPGAGKSFGVKEILKYLTRPKEGEVKKHYKNSILNFNLSQFNSLDDLYHAFVKISDLILKGVTPVVFWDEFDSTFNGKRYGWLKYFLAPMEDGEYYADNTTHNVGSCIYVFAGSNSESWDEFVDLSAKRDEGDCDLSKITDFISRISGYIDVMGPNKYPNDETAYMQRRAIFIRKTIENVYGVDENTSFIIDEDILWALFHVKEYKHGSRSLSNLISQFKNNSGDSLHIKKYCIPNQLDLYVDKADFEKALAEGNKVNLSK